MNNKIFNIFSLSLVLIVLGSCEVDTKKTKPIDPHRMELDNTSQYYDQNYKVYTLEGCEYIVIGVGKTQWGSHKGNCKNPIHKYESTSN